MNRYAISTLNIYLTELYRAHKLNDFDIVMHYHTMISTYAVAMIDFGVDFFTCDALCSEAYRVMSAMY